MKKNSFYLIWIMILSMVSVYGQTVSNYNLGNGSTFTNTGVQWDPVTSTTSPDGKLRTQAATTKWHSAGYGVSFQNGNSLEIDVLSGENIVRFYGSVHSAGTMSGGTTLGGNDLGAINVDLDTHPGMSDQTGYYEFVYTGSATTLFFTFAGNNAYTPSIQITNTEVEVIKTDVWDFGAAELDPLLFNNHLTVDVMNAFHNASVTPGASGVNMPSFTAGILGYVTNNANSDRLRTTNTNLTRWDENIASSTTFTGRLYVNSGANINRYLTLMLDEDDEVTLNVRTDAGGTLNFQYVQDPTAQTDIVAIPAAEVTENFVAKAAGEYRIFDTSGKPSYFRVYRKAATYITISGNVNETFATNIPDGYSIVFTNEAGKNFSVVVENGTYSIDLPAGYTYQVSLGGANGFIIATAQTLEVTEESTSFDITVLQVNLYEVTGVISGLTDLGGLVLNFVPDAAAETIYDPIVTIDFENATYSVNLESNVNYTISAEGVNDYEILANTINIAPANQTFDIAFTAKPLFDVDIIIPNLTASQFNDLNLTFSNLNEEGYVYEFEDIQTVSLRNGTYSITYSGLDLYPIEMALTSNLIVNSVNTSKTLNFNPVTEWTFNERVINAATAYKGLIFTGNVNVRGNNGDLNVGAAATVAIPVLPGDKVIITDYYQSSYSIEGGEIIQNTSNSTSTNVTAEYFYEGTEAGFVTLTATATSYFVSIKVVSVVPFSETITVGIDKDYQTINGALDAISRMERPNDERVTVLIDPGNYEEMIVIENKNITLQNASSNPSIGLLNMGVDIEPNAVRITSYYGQKYNFFSQGTDNKWNAAALEVNLANGYTNYVNKEGTGGGSSYWNATVVVKSEGFIAKDLILENSFNQYISLKESQDVVVAKASSEPTRPTNYGNTDVQNRALGYVTQAAAIGIAASADKVILDECRVIGRQDSFYGAQGARVAIYKGAMMGAVDYLFGGMTAVFYQTDLVLNTSDSSNDAAYITAAQQTSGRGYLMYECHVKSTIPQVETASLQGSKPGYFGRPWAPNTSEVVFYNTTIDASTYAGSEGLSLISPQGWTSSLGGQSSMMYEYGTIENANGIDNSDNRASWSTVLENPTLTDGTEITLFNFTKGNDDWDPFDSLILSTNQNTFESKVDVKAYQQQIHFSNVKSSTNVRIYNLTGALIYSFETSEDKSIDIATGFWLVHVQDNDGQKSVKLISK